MSLCSELTGDWLVVLRRPPITEREAAIVPFDWLLVQGYIALRLSVRLR